VTTASSAPPGSHGHPDHVGAKLGMWLFLFTELILFGGLFLAYSAYRRLHPDDFHRASQELNLVLGVVNTLVLLTSSLTMALSVSAIRLGKRAHSVGFLSTTILFGCLFLVNKYFEWTAKIHHGIYPGSASLMQREPGERLFFGLYYAMTGLHGVHVIVGVSVLGVMVWLLGRGRIRPDAYIALENAGLYWHLVDVVWIFLLPLFYLAA
jgi:cytochrome c oxidase subunit 3